MICPRKSANHLRTLSLCQARPIPVSSSPTRWQNDPTPATTKCSCTWLTSLVSLARSSTVSGYPQRCPHPTIYMAAGSAIIHRV